MPLAVSSYAGLHGLADDDKFLNLAWTIDEQAYLGIDLPALVAEELTREVSGGTPSISTYGVDDPYGEARLGPAVARFFGTPDGFSVTCGAGVNSLLYALAHLAHGGTTVVVGNVYPDLPVWIERLTAIRPVGIQLGQGGWPIADIEAAKARLVVLERPMLTATAASVEMVQDICSIVAKHGGIVLVDESYANYCPPSYSACTVSHAVTNLVVLRGLSKAYWLGGLRLGYCVASEPLTHQVRALVPPMLASSLSLTIGRRVLEQGDIGWPLRTRIETAKVEVIDRLAQVGLGKDAWTAPFLPYVAFSDRRDILGWLERCGILGKRQLFWDAGSATIMGCQRLSIPLAPHRLARFHKSIGSPERQNRRG
ncbi:aminotransferase class I/II-fold pyridoxal phosphate-dependent enzyme [Mesorhizobium sp. LSHC414A00]|uniref:aminotransferase class I/II-fold pyridoxal phosphate-dependent enzyme n=1 Tax=Mesorhizobium sp. LSHC414A00 TaxID=1287287 RepID=UPI00041746D2|nr:aminotransferase class I/II-fold pyridoxal phosphate-dependent enzyme [Mesorhizobium sp. LSHC414A00]